MIHSNLVAIRDEVVTIGGHRIAYTAAGNDGTPVVLVHGGASDRRDWTKNISALAASHRVYAPDLIGFGQSSRPKVSYTMRMFSEFLCDFMDAPRGYRGHSWWATPSEGGRAWRWRGKRRTE